MSNLLKSQRIKSGKKHVLSYEPYGTKNRTKQNFDRSDVAKEESAQAENEWQKRIERLKAEHDTLLHQMNEMKKQAEDEMDKWWKEQEKQLKLIEKESRKKGQEQGYQEGLQKAERTYKQKLSEIEEVVRDAYDQQSRIIEEAEPFLLRVSTEIARKIIGNELRQHPEQIQHFVQEGLRNCQEANDVRIFVHPYHFMMLQTQIEELREIVHGSEQVQVVPDESLMEGDCRIRTHQGTYQVGIDNQLHEIKKALLTAYEEHAD